MPLFSKISFPFQLWASHLWPLFMKSLRLRQVFLACTSVQAVFGIVFLNDGYQNENKLHLHRCSPQSFSDVFPFSPENVTSRAQPFDPPSLFPVVDGHQLWTAAVSGEAEICNSVWGQTLRLLYWGQEKKPKLLTQTADFRSKLCWLDWCPQPHL